MKKLNRIKLIDLNQTPLSDKEKSFLLGGDDCCGCGCHQSASTFQNANGNSAQGYGQSSGGTVTCYHWTEDSDGDGYYDEGHDQSTCW